MKTTNYYNTFIAVADDCPVSSAEIPPRKGMTETVANIQYDMIMGHPYEYTSDDVVFEVFARKNSIPPQQRKAEREKFFSKGQPCLRSSPLCKRYGWGVHFDAAGKIALYGVGSKEYQKMLKDKKLEQVKAMRSKRL